MPNCYYYDEQRNRCNCYVNENLNELLAENAKLVDVLHEVETEAVYAYRCLQQDCITTAESSEHFFKKWWHAECMNDNRLKRIDQLEAENARLRELVAVMPRCWNADCEGCPMAAGKTVYGYGAERCIAEDKLRELGVEVDG